LEIYFMLQSTLRASFAHLLSGDAYVPPLAPIAVLALLGAGFALVVSGVGAAVALAAGRRSLARLLAGAALAVASGYATALAAASLLSPPRTLAAGEKKYFCELDCHLAYSVARAAREDGRQVVTIRTWFDPRTIASFRGDAPLFPNPREVYLELGGRRVPPATESTRQWRESHGERTTLADPLRPGESYETTFVFDTGASGASEARLFLGDPPGIETLLIGHENSPLHGRTLFALPGAGSASSESAPRLSTIDAGGRS
jgi:hypothetical protein